MVAKARELLAVPATEPEADEDVADRSTSSSAPAAAGACSSSRPSQPGCQPQHWPTTPRPPSGSTRHEHDRSVQRRSRFLLRWSATGCDDARAIEASDTTFAAPIMAVALPLSVPQPVQTRSPTAAINSARTPIPSPPPEPPRPNPHSARGTVAAHLSRVPSLEAFGHRPRCLPHRRDGPASETLHKLRSSTVVPQRPFWPEDQTKTFHRSLWQRVGYEFTI